MATLIAKHAWVAAPMVGSGGVWSQADYFVLVHPAAFLLQLSRNLIMLDFVCKEIV
jgi:hypothetical protein